MARQRAYITNAERQKAYRERLKNSQEQPKPKIRPPRPLSRPKRLKALLQEAEDLLLSYTDWLEALPENLRSGGQAEKLQETINSLEHVVDLLSNTEAPKGFGRD